MVRVVVVDDHTSVREIAGSGSWHDLDVVGIYPHTEAFLGDGVRPGSYDVIVLDLQLNPPPGHIGAPPASGTAAIRAVRNAGHGPVLLYTGIVADAVIAACLEAGANGAVSKNSPTSELSRLVAVVAKSGFDVDSTMAGALKRLKSGLHAGGLSPQQGRVITLLAQGLSQDVIASTIGVASRKSVENYLRSAVDKLSAWNVLSADTTGAFAAREAAVALGLADGLVRLQDLEQARRERNRAAHQK